MDQNIVESTQLEELTGDEQARIAQYVNDVWQQGDSDRKPFQEEWQAALKAYNCEFDPVKDPRNVWKSNIFLPWSFDTIEIWLAYMQSMLLPQDEDFFTFQGRVRADDPGAEVMEKYLRHTFNLSGLSEKFGEFLRQLGIYGNSVLKTSWKKQTRQVPDWIDTPIIDPVTNQPAYLDGTGIALIDRKLGQKEEVVHNHAWFEIVDINDFMFYPLDGDFERTTKIHQTWRFLEEIKALAADGTAPYFNLDKLEEAVSSDDRGAVAQAAGSTYQHYKGVRLREAWIHRVRIGDKIFRNVIATVAHEDTLIRFQPNPKENGRTPFIFCSLIPTLNRLLGVGMIHKSLGLQKMGNFMTNSRLDEVKLKTYGQYKYVDDGVFNPFNFVVRPGGLTKVGNLENLTPLPKDLQGVQINREEVLLIKDEFEEVTVPKVVKGQLETGERTATEMSLANKGAGGKMNAQAQRINEKVLKPLIEQTYLDILQHMQSEPWIVEDVARVTQNPIYTITHGMDGTPLPQPVEVTVPVNVLVQNLPRFLPLPEIDVKVIGYQNQLAKQQTMAAMQQIITELAQTPAVNYIDWMNAGRLACRMLGVSQDEIFVSDEQKQQIDDQQAQQAQLQQQMAVQDARIKQATMQQAQQAKVMQAQNYAQKEQNNAVQNHLKAIEMGHSHAMNQAAHGLNKDQLGLGIMQALHQMVMDHLTLQQAEKQMNEGVSEGE